jgi:hypothetical protein
MLQSALTWHGVFIRTGVVEFFNTVRGPVGVEIGATTAMNPKFI